MRDVHIRRGVDVVTYGLEEVKRLHEALTKVLSFTEDEIPPYKIDGYEDNKFKNLIYSIDFKDGDFTIFV